MKGFILETRNGIHIINLEETLRQIDTAANFLSDLARARRRSFSSAASARRKMP